MAFPPNSKIVFIKGTLDSKKVRSIPPPTNAPPPKARPSIGPPIKLPATKPITPIFRFSPINFEYVPNLDTCSALTVNLVASSLAAILAKTVLTPNNPTPEAMAHGALNPIADAAINPHAPEDNSSP